ncbi:MAG: prepilin peptidase [Proteobacteria bacterium]|nr:prepilin peptidase [Pseudomonadota bacterium]
MSEVLTFIPQWQILIFSGLFGAAWGSFANVVIARWPLEMSVVRPGSHCFSCQAKVRPWDNIPVLSYFILRGKCRHCGASFSLRYVFVELLLALFSVAVMQRALALYPDAPGWLLGTWLIWFAFIWALVVVAMIDLACWLIPDSIVLPGIAVGVAANALGLLPLGWLEPVVAAGIAYAGLRLLFIDGYQLLTGKPGMGLGDAKLLALFGAFLGYEGTLFALFAGAFQGLVVGLGMVLFRRRKGLDNEPVFEEDLGEDGAPLEPTDDRLRKAKVPFGPFLAAGAIEYLFVGEALIAHYTKWVFYLTLRWFS